MMEEQKECVDFELGAFVALVDKVIIQRNGSWSFASEMG